MKQEMPAMKRETAAVKRETPSMKQEALIAKRGVKHEASDALPPVNLKGVANDELPKNEPGVKKSESVERLHEPKQPVDGSSAFSTPKDFLHNLEVDLSHEVHRKLSGPSVGRNGETKIEDITTLREYIAFITKILDRKRNKLGLLEDDTR